MALTASRSACAIHVICFLLPTCTGPLEQVIHQDYQRLHAYPACVPRFHDVSDSKLGRGTSCWAE